MIIGFTGTRKGMSEVQVRQLRYVVALLRHADKLVSRTTEFHHGGAVGADTTAGRNVFGCDVHVHPCPGVVRDPASSPNELWHEVFPALVRNRHIVAVSNLLIAAPYTDREEQRSGTWATIRAARKAGIPVVMLSRGDL